MNKNILPLEELYTGHIFDMNDELTILEIFERQENQKIRSQKLSEIQNFLQTCSLEDFVYVIIRIFKDKTPVIKTLEDLISKEIYSFSYDLLFDFKVQSKIKNAHFSYTKDNGNIIFQKLQFNFSSNINITSLLTSAKECLYGKNFNVTGNKIIISNCPIGGIEFTSKYIMITMNPEKATKYGR